MYSPVCQGRLLKRNEEKTSIYMPDTTSILKTVYCFKTVDLIATQDILQVIYKITGFLIFLY